MIRHYGFYPKRMIRHYVIHPTIYSHLYAKYEGCSTNIRVVEYNVDQGSSNGGNPLGGLLKYDLGRDVPLRLEK